jgi:hypothetical protein
MIKPTLLSLLFLVACAAPPAPPAPLERIAQQFDAAMPAQPLAAMSALVPLPAATLTDSELSVTIVGHYGAAQTRDRSWIVQVGPDTRVLSYSSSAGAAGAALNIPGSNQVDVLTRQLALPAQVTAGDALVVVSGAPAGSFSSIDEAMAVVFVPYAVHSGLLRPPAIGSNWLARHFRLSPIPESLVDMARIPAVIDMASIYQPGGPVNPAAWGAAPPTIAGMLAEVGRFSGELTDGWGVASTAPLKQHRGYGTFFGGQTSTALCLAMTTMPAEQRRPLVLALVQRGLDQVGATCDSRVLYPNGGHCQGRKALVIFAGHALNVEAFCTPSLYFPNAFQEDRGYPAQAWWFGGGWTVGWAFRSEAPFNGQLLATHPSTWGDRNAPAHNTWNWLFGYFSQVVPCQVGSALAMCLIGREQEFGRCVQMVRQFMQGPPPAADAALRAAGHEVPWGKDYATPAGFCATAWNLYAPAQN